MQAILVKLCGFLLRMFFRKIEVLGRQHLPQDGRVVFVLNHPSGLIDPLFILCLARRRVSFLAKEPLFRMPIVGWFVRAFECLPVYRAQDGANPTQNRAMMIQAVELLTRGNALALFPEGTSHSDPSLKPFRTGAARIALSARSLGAGPVHLVPAALYYEAKDVFRSRAVLAFGESLETPEVQLEETAEPPREVARALTLELKAALARIMPTATSVDDLVLAEQAERILWAAQRDGLDFSEGKSPSLGERMTRRRSLIDAYLELERTEPQRLEALITRVRKLAAQLEAAGLPVDAPLGTSTHRGASLGHLVAWLVVLFPLGAMGTIIHLATYRLIHFLAFRYAGHHLDVVATAKLLGGLLLYPLTWLLWAGLVAGFSGEPAWLVSALLGPPLGWVTLRYYEILGAVSRRRRLGRVRQPHWDTIFRERSEVGRELLTLLHRRGGGPLPEATSTPGETPR